MPLSQSNMAWQGIERKQEASIRQEEGKWKAT